MTDVEKAVRLRREPGHRGPVFAGPEIVGNDLPDEIDGSAGCFLWSVHVDVYLLGLRVEVKEPGKAGDVAHPPDDPVPADDRQDLEHRWPGQLAGDDGPHGVDQHARLDVEFLGHLAGDPLGLDGVEGLQLLIAVGKGRQPGRQVGKLQDVFLQRLVVDGEIVGKVGPAEAGKVLQRVEAVANQIDGVEKPLLPCTGPGVIPQSRRLELLLHHRRQVGDRHGPQVVLVDGDGLRVGEELRVVAAEVEDGAGAVDPFEGEGLDQFLPGEDLPVVAGRPAEKDEKVVEGPGDEAVVTVEMDGDDLAVAALGDLRLLVVEGQRDVGEDRQRRLQGLIEQDLADRVGHVVLTADDVGDAIADVSTTWTGGTAVCRWMRRSERSRPPPGSRIRSGP